MRNLPLIMFYIILILVSCHETNEFKIRRIIVNESSIPVSVNVYRDGEAVESFGIQGGERNVKDERCEEERGNTDCDLLTGADVRWNRLTDSVIVLFNNERKLLFCSEFLECYSGYKNRNIMALPLYLENDEHNTGYIKTIDGDTQVYTYTITEEDYQNAEPIGN